MLRAAGLLLLVIALPVASAAEVRLGDGVFEPSTLDARPGESVTWVNADDRPHTVTSSWDDGATFHRVLRPGESFTHTFPEAGEYDIHCVPHVAKEDGHYVGMVMRVRVAEAAAAPGPEPRSASYLVALGAAGGLTLLGAMLLALRQRGARA